MAKLMNYTTSIPAFKSIGEIQEFLINFGAQNIIIDSENKKVKAIKFTYRIGDMILPFKVPADVDETAETLWNEYLSSKHRMRKTKADFYDEAERVAWRIARDWVHAQLSLLTIKSKYFMHIFAGFLVTDTKTQETLGDRLEGGDFQKLLKGRE